MTTYTNQKATVTEWERLRQVWAALGCEQNPDDFKPRVREQMWEQAVEMMEVSTTRDGRVYRENQGLEALLAEIRRILADDWSPDFGTSASTKYAGWVDVQRTRALRNLLGVDE